MAQTQPLTEMLTAVMSANTPAAMETLSNAQLAMKTTPAPALLSLSSDEDKSLRLLMHCLRALCSLCLRCGRHLRAVCSSLILATLRIHLLLIPLKEEEEKKHEERVDLLLSGGRASCAGHCRWLWLSVRTACSSLQASCPEEWRHVTSTLEGVWTGVTV